MLVREMMAPSRTLLAKDTPLREAARLLAECECEAAPVVDDSGVLAGIVTEIDLLRDRFEPKPTGYARCVPGASGTHPHTVCEVMTRAVVTASEGDDADELAHRMIETRLRCVPVLRGGTIAGVVRRRDVLAAYLRPDAEIHEELLAAIARRVPTHEEMTVTVDDGVVTVTGPAPAGTGRVVAALGARSPGSVAPRSPWRPWRRAPVPTTSPGSGREFG
ncbi:CBS domain-containing protein [Salinactinospora qingdaonensis]|uniref:CBS domain-containing protein n=1 Tax=Salinactinospora qingdaonensis TaxID=702744 RepID=A0ABP7GBW5_9ACTN